MLGGTMNTSAEEGRISPGIGWAARAAAKITAVDAVAGRIRVAAGKYSTRTLPGPHLPFIPPGKMGAFKRTPDSLPVFRITVPFGRIRLVNKPMLIVRRDRRMKFPSHRRLMPVRGFPRGVNLNLRDVF